MTSNLSDFIKNNSKFLKIADGQTVEVAYKGFSVVPDRFRPGQETVSYLFAYPDGKTTNWNKSSTKVAAQMAKINVGDMISITRLGEGTETAYRIKSLAGKPLGQAEPDESPF